MTESNADEGTETQPDTAPLSEEFFQTTADVSWGKLVPIDCKQNWISLRDTSYKIGRSPKCDVYIHGGVFDQKILDRISKYHFKITRSTLESNAQIVHIEDLSSNGTYVNGEIVGRNNSILLENNDEIALAHPSIKVYMYIDGTVIDTWLHSEMRRQYHVLKHLGSGGFSEVKLVVDKTSFSMCAMKKILKGSSEGKKIYNEIKVLQKLSHPNIIKMLDVADTPQVVYISLEYMAGGDLQGVLANRRKITEPEAKNIFYQIVTALEYLHNEGITHRDIKPANVLLERTDNLRDVRIKLSDFGLSKIINGDTDMTSRCGTFNYIAPEILHSCSERYTNMVDVWSLGVLLFVCLSGHHPFQSDENEDRKVSVLKILKGDFDKNRLIMVSKSARDLIGRMLVVCPKRRINVQNIMRHHWIKDISSLTSQKAKVSDENENLEDEIHRCKIQKLN